MRIHLLGEPWGSSSGITSEISLDHIFSEHHIVRGIIRRVTSHTVSLQLKQLEVELPVANMDQNLKQSLKAGLQVELTRADEETLALKVLPAPSEQGLDQEVLLSRELESVLVELNVPPTREAVMVAQGLLQRGFPLQKDLLWRLLPWAEREQLEEAFQLLQARFPLEPSLVEMVAQLRARDVSRPLFPGVKNELSSELQELLKHPSWEGRRSWGDKFADGELFKALIRLVVEERFLEALSPGFVFALPFLLGDDLWVSWVRIAKDDDSQSKEAGAGTTSENLKVELQIPTINLGLVEVELWVREKALRIDFQVDDSGAKVLGECVEQLKRELATSGWEQTQIGIGGRDHA